MLDFQAIKAAVSIEQVAQWLGVKLRRSGNDQFRGKCPICDHDSDRAFVVTVSKQMYHSFGACQSGGDCLTLYAKAKKLSVKAAAEELNAHFKATTPEDKPVPTLAGVSRHPYRHGYRERFPWKWGPHYEWVRPTRPLRNGRLFLEKLD